MARNLLADPRRNSCPCRSRRNPEEANREPPTIKKSLAAIAVSTMMFTTASHAAPVTWTLQNWMFNDGGTASGSFVFDAGTSAYSNVSVQSTDGTVRTGASYALPNPASSGNSTFAAWVTGLLADFTNTPVIAVNWASALTDAGGTVGVDLAGFHGEFACADVICSAATSPTRLLVSGAVTTAAVPLPATLPLVGLALLLLGAVRRHR